MADGEQHSVPPKSLLEDNSQPRPPLAWQPFTPSGIAAFQAASYGRVVLVTSLVAACIGVLACWFVHQDILPVLEKAILNLPETGAIEDQQLILTNAPGSVLAEERILGIVIDQDGREFPALASDFQVILQREGMGVCSLLGCLWMDYPAGWRIEVNRNVWEPGLEAWKPMFIGVLFVSVVAYLMICWHLLATLYFLFPWVGCYYSDRRLTLSESWRLAMISLMPGAILMAGAILFYGLGWADLVRFSVMGLLHIVLPWAYLLMSARKVPRVDSASAGKGNPFGPPPPPESKRKSGTGTARPPPGPPHHKNPFADRDIVSSQWRDS